MHSPGSRAAVHAQSQPSLSSTVFPFGERRSRPRHGTLQSIEDVVYRALREQARARRAAALPPRARIPEPPPTLVLHSEPESSAPATQVLHSDAVPSRERTPAIERALFAYTAFRLGVCKLSSLLTGKCSA